MKTNGTLMYLDTPAPYYTSGTYIGMDKNGFLCNETYNILVTTHFDGISVERAGDSKFVGLYKGLNDLFQEWKFIPAYNVDDDCVESEDFLSNEYY